MFNGFYHNLKINLGNKILNREQEAIASKMEKEKIQRECKVQIDKLTQEKETLKRQIDELSSERVLF
jgi:hypothetical protein